MGSRSQRNRIIAAATLICAGGQGILLNANSVFMKPVAEALGFLRGDFAIYTSVTMFATMLIMPLFAGLLLKPYFKRVMFVSAIICSLATFGFSLSTKLWHFYVFAGFIGACYCGIGMQVAANLINNWIVEAKGTVLGMAFAGSGLGGAVMLYLAGTLIEGLGWQYGYMAMAVCSLGAIMVALFLLRGIPIYPDPPEPPVLAEAAPGSKLARIRDNVRRPEFVLLLVATLVSCLGVGAVNNNAVAYASDNGHGALALSAMASLAMFLAIGTKVLTGKVIDRFGVKVGVYTMFLGMAIAFIFLLLIKLPFAPYLVALGQALFMSGGVTNNVVMASFSTREEFALRQSVSSSVAYLGMAIASPIPGMIFDRTGSYVPAWYMSLFVYVITLLCTLAAIRIARRSGRWQRSL